MNLRKEEHRKCKFQYAIELFLNIKMNIVFVNL